MRNVELGTLASVFSRLIAAVLYESLVVHPPGKSARPTPLVLAFRAQEISQPPLGRERVKAMSDWRRERPKMYIYGTSQIHAAQPLNAPHRLTPASAPGGSYSSAGVDQLDISPEADFVAQARDLPEIREDRVAAIRAQIQNGTYETSDKLDVALSRLLDEIA